MTVSYVNIDMIINKIKVIDRVVSCVESLAQELI